MLVEIPVTVIIVGICGFLLGFLIGFWEWCKE
jgi:hypothetical protein